MRDVCAWIERGSRRRRDELTLIGSSLGGFYATFLAEKYGARAVVINPAIRPYDDLRPYRRTAAQPLHRRRVRRHAGAFRRAGSARGDAHHAARALFPARAHGRRAPRLAQGGRSSTRAPSSTSPAAATTAGRISATRWTPCCGLPDAACDAARLPAQAPTSDASKRRQPSTLRQPTYRSRAELSRL